jgi:hypothetical protein
VIWTGLIWLGIEISGTFLEHRSELSGSIQCWELLQLSSKLMLLKKDSSPWSHLVTVHMGSFLCSHMLIMALYPEEDRSMESLRYGTHGLITVFTHAHHGSVS